MSKDPTYSSAQDDLCVSPMTVLAPGASDLPMRTSSAVELDGLSIFNNRYGVLVETARATIMGRQGNHTVEDADI